MLFLVLAWVARLIFPKSLLRILHDLVYLVVRCSVCMEPYRKLGCATGCWHFLQQLLDSRVCCQLS